MNTAVLILALVAPCLGRTPFPSSKTQAMYRMNHEPYIIGGENADENEWPWQGFMEYFGSFYCGVTIISDEWVLTAAHCIFGATPNSISVGLGYTDRSSNQGSMYDVDEVIEHPDFIFITSLGDDVGVMHLTTALEFSDNLQPITLASSGDDFAGTEGCYITGWGDTGTSPFLPNDLQEAMVDVYTLEECEAIWGANSIEDNEHVCVGIQNQSGSCNGDSGGPAQCPTDDGWVQIGITSWGAIGCDTAFPSVYTNVGWFNSWISENCGGCI